MLAVDVVNDPEKGRFSAIVDGVIAGFTEYRVHSGDLYFFVHTEVDDDFSGAGVATMLIEGALNDVRAKGGRVVPLCPFVRAFIEGRPEYNDMVDKYVLGRARSKDHD